MGGRRGAAPDGKVIYSGALHSFRRTRVWHERALEWGGVSWGFHPVWRNLSDLFRLQPQRVAPGCADEGAHDLRLYARLDRSGPGRSDASVDRTNIEFEADSAHGCVAARRYDRIGSGLGRGVRAQRRPVLPGAFTPDAAL